MSTKKYGLGRGFESLIPTDILDETFDPTAEQDEQVSDLRYIKIDEIQADPQQPRRQFDEVALSELADSIRRYGIVQPLVVTPSKQGYQIVAGERRYRAAKLAGLEKVPALVRTLNAQRKLELSLIENLQRRDLNILETATAYLKLRDQFNLTLDEIGHRVGGRSVSSVSNTLRLLKLSKSARLALSAGKLREGQARPLIGLDGAIVDELVPRIIKEEWSARRIEQFIVQLKRGNAQVTPSKARPITDTPYQDDTVRLEKRLATNISVRTNTRGAGQIVIKFKNDADFQRIKKILENAD